MSYLQKGAVALIVLISLGLSTYQFLWSETETLSAVSGVASFTYFVSYAACCPKSPNYNPNADKTECQDDSACDYLGDFAAIGHKSYDWVKSHNLISFYDNRDPRGSNFQKKYGGRTVTLKKGGVQFDAIVADTCGNQDCNNCCSRNSQPTGFLVDMEYNTVLRHFGSLSKADGQIEFIIH